MCQNRHILFFIVKPRISQAKGGVHEGILKERVGNIKTPFSLLNYQWFLIFQFYNITIFAAPLLASRSSRYQFHVIVTYMG